MHCRQIRIMRRRMRIFMSCITNFSLCNRPGCLIVRIIKNCSESKPIPWTSKSKTRWRRVFMVFIWAQRAEITSRSRVKAMMLSTSIIRGKVQIGAAEEILTIGRTCAQITCWARSKWFKNPHSPNRKIHWFSKSSRIRSFIVWAFEERRLWGLADSQLRCENMKRNSPYPEFMWKNVNK